MSLVKTEKGRAALLNRDLGLTPRERQILLMSDGKRTHAQMSELFTSNVSADLERLLQLNLLIDVSRKQLTPDNLTATGTFRASDLSGLLSQPGFRRTSGFASSQGDVVTRPTAVNKPVVGVPKTRRSMAAAKMYTLDILQRMRDMESPSFSVAIQTSSDEADLAENLINAVRYVYRKSGDNFGAKVFEKVYETIPEQYLLDMEHLALELGGSTLGE